MSWAEEALAKAAEAARKDLAQGATREAALAGLEALATEAPALERAGRARLRGMAANLIAGDVVAAKRSIAQPDGAASALDALAGANRELLSSYDAEREGDWDAIWGAVGRVGITAAKAALPFLLAAAGI